MTTMPDSPPPIPAAAVEAGAKALSIEYNKDDLPTGGWAEYHRLCAAAVLRAALPHLASPAGDASAKPLAFTYRNWRGEIGQRLVRPISMLYGATEWHPEPQWLLYAYDLDKCETRSFAVKDISFGEGTASPAGDDEVLTGQPLRDTLDRARKNDHIADLRQQLTKSEDDCAIFMASNAALTTENMSLRAERDEARRERDETFTDETGNMWSRPTAWAYYAVCKALNAPVARADKAEAERDALAERLRASEHLLAHRTKQMDTSRRFWLRAAKSALAGAPGELRNRVELAEAGPLDIVQSTADPEPGDPMRGIEEAT